MTGAFDELQIVRGAVLIVALRERCHGRHNGLREAQIAELAGQRRGRALADPAFKALRPPSTTDLMGYCGFQWISDYNYSAILDYRAASGAVVAAGGRERAMGRA